MANPEWGKKRICLACNTKYYDLNKSPIICPSCGTEFDPDTNIIKSRKVKSLLTKLVPENNQNMSEEILNIDDDETDTNEEVVTDDDPFLEINKQDQSTDSEVDINIDDEMAWIDDDDINEDDEVSEEIIDEKK